MMADGGDQLLSCAMSRRTSGGGILSLRSNSQGAGNMSGHFHSWLLFSSLSRFCDAKYIRGESQSSVRPGVSCVRCISIECNVVLLAPLCNYYNNITAGGAGCRHRRYHGAQLSSWSTGACISVTPVITLLTSPHFLSYPVRRPDVPGERCSR